MHPPPKLSGGALAIALLLVCPNGISETERGSNADTSNAPRVTIDRPKPTFMLMERDKRVHGLKPFQDLVDKAPAGSVLKPPPGRYAGPVVINKPLTIDGVDHSIDATGDGPVDAAFNAVKMLYPHKAQLHLYQVQAVTEGTDAQATVSVRVEEDGRIATGQSADTDTVVASVKAYVNALNRLIVRRTKSAPGENVKSVNFKDAS